MAKHSGLTAQQEKFSVEVAKGKSQADAYRKAYPRSNRWKDSSVWPKASELAKRAHVAARIAELREKSSMSSLVTVERVLQERARLAFYDPRKFYDEHGQPLAITDLDEDTAAVVSGFDLDPEKFTTKIKMADKDKSLTALEKHLGMYKDDDKGGSILNIQINLT